MKAQAREKARIIVSMIMMKRSRKEKEREEETKIDTRRPKLTTRTELSYSVICP